MIVVLEAVFVAKAVVVLEELIVVDVDLERVVVLV